MKDNVLICSCHDIEHQLIFTYDEDDNIIYMHIHLVNHNNILKRLLIGIKYILGYKCRYGNFDEFIIDVNNIEDFRKVITKIKE